MHPASAPLSRAALAASHAIHARVLDLADAELRAWCAVRESVLSIAHAARVELVAVAMHDADDLLVVAACGIADARDALPQGASDVDALLQLATEAIGEVRDARRVRTRKCANGSR